jgi:chromosome partitioning protein
MRTIAVANSKGGSAKTTTAIHLAVGLARTGQKTLLIDVDPQGHVGEGLGVTTDQLTGAPTVAQVLARKARLEDARLHHEHHLDLVLAAEELAYYEPDLYKELNRENRLKNALAGVAHLYDFAIIDCPPYMNMLTINALTAANTVLIPMVAEYLALKGVERLATAITTIAEELNPELTIFGILPTRVGRTVNAREVLQAAHAQYEEHIPVLPMTIPETVKFREAMGLGQSIFDYAPETPGAVAYQLLVNEVLRGS